MFKYTKRLFSDIQFWSRELKIRAKENSEFERIEDEAEGGFCHPMNGFVYYRTMNHNRSERKRIHKEQRNAIE